MFKIIFQIIMVVAFLFPDQGFAFSVTAQVDRNEISINDYLGLKVVFDGGEGEVDTAPITDFQIVSRSSSSNVSIINGSYSKTVTAVFQLLPRTKGRLAIPSLPVSHDGKVYHTQPIEVMVSDSPVAPEDNRDIFVRAKLSHEKLFVGQQGIYRFQLFSAVQFSNARLQKPEFEGFSVEEMGEPREFTRNINGRRYRGVEISYLIIPRTPGRLTIDPSFLSCDVVVQDRTRSRDPFGDSFFSNGFFAMGRTQPRRFSTKAISLEVMPLPPHDEKVPFSGLVGQFNFSASLDNNAIKAGESATLTVTLSGTGNVMDAKMPKLTLPDSFKLYEDSPVEDIQLTPKGYQGSKTFKRALVPVSPGIFTLPVIDVSYFDVVDNAYKTLTSPSMTLTVAPGAAQEQPLVTATTAPPADKAVTPRQVAFTGRDILELKEGPGLLTTRFSMPFSLFMLLYLLPFVLFFLGQAVFRMMNKGADPVMLLGKKADDYLKKSENSDEDDQGFLRNLYMAMMCRMLWVAREPERSMTIEAACEMLNKKGVASETVNQVGDVMYDIESARYGKGALDHQARKVLLGRVKAIMKLLCLVLVFGMLTGVFPTWVNAQPREVKDSGQGTTHGTTLLEGISAYKEGRFKAAAETFSHLASQGMENGELYYNAGNAFLKAGDIGRAILWYERAKMLMPQDPDLRFNLAHAKTFVQDKSDAPGIDITDMLFFWKNYLPPWLMVWAAIFLSAIFAVYAGVRTRKKKRVFTLAGIIFFVAVILAGTTVCYDYYEKENGRFAVILSREAAIHSGLSSDSTTLFVLHAGTRVRVEEKRDGYLKIIFSRDKIGWIGPDDAEMI